MQKRFLIWLSIPLFIACNSSVSKIFGGKDKTPHEKYADKIDDQPAGKQWLELSGKSLLNPQSIQLPYRQRGYFPAGKPRALTLQFTAKRGEHVNFDLLKKNITGLMIYADVFKTDGTVVTPILAAALTDSTFGFDAEETGTYILRLQPELESNGEYSLSVTLSPSLGFPVAGNKARVGSVWGDARDNGERNHEGIDIFAVKLTPAIAAADGTISSVKDGGLGGKTIYLKVKDRNLSLYYAHLDQQLVEEGQRVKKGDTIGLVGNTGNAKAGSPHLHFGIYTSGGAIDPLPFVNKIVRIAAPPAPVKDLSRRLQLTKAITIKDTVTIKANTILVPLAITATGWLVELADGTIIQTPFKSVKTI